MKNARLALCTDFNNKLVIPSLIVIYQLGLDFFFSKMHKTCLIIELTCCWEEYVQVCHQKKIITLISKSIQSNRWPVHLFAIEVGARGYCSTDVKSCLSRPGFMSKLLTLTIKKLSLSSLKVPFQLWLSRDCESGLRKQWQYPP